MNERLALKVAVAVAALLPVTAGLLGIIAGFEVFGRGAAVPVDMTSHGRYLSGLLLGIGFAYWSTIPRIETHGARFRLLTAIVFVGGLARLCDLYAHGVPSIPMQVGLVMELVIAPALALWRERVDRLCRNSGASGPGFVTFAGSEDGPLRSNR